MLHVMKALSWGGKGGGRGGVKLTGESGYIRRVARAITEVG